MIHSKRYKNLGGVRKKRSTRKSYVTRMRGGTTRDLAHEEYIKNQNLLLHDMLYTKNVRLRRNHLPITVNDNRQTNAFKTRNDSLLVSSGQGVVDTSSISGAEYLTNK